MAGHWVEIVLVVDGPVEIVGSGSISYEGHGAGHYFRYRAVPDDGWRFKKWEITCSGGAGAPVMVETLFEQSGDTFETEENPLSPSVGMRYISGEDSGESSSDDYTLHISRLVAVFEKTTPPYVAVTVSAYNYSPETGTVTVNQFTDSSHASATGVAATDGSYGFPYTITATPADGYRFLRWTDYSTDATRFGTAYSDLNFTAVFVSALSVSLLQGIVDGVSVDILINASNISGMSTHYAEGDTVSVSYTPEEGATPVIFRAARYDYQTNTYVSLWNADGLTTKTFTMPNADVVVAIGCFYEKATLTPGIVTDNYYDSVGGTVSPPSVSKGNGETVSFTATANKGYMLGFSKYKTDEVWDWRGVDIVDLGGAPDTQSGPQTSAKLRGDAAGKVASLPSWTGLNSLDAKWFFKSGYDVPTAYFFYAANTYFVKVTFETYGSHGEAEPLSARDDWLALEGSDTYNSPDFGGRVSFGDESGYIILGLVRETVGGARTIIYKYSGSGGTVTSRYDVLAPAAQKDGKRYHYHVWVWPKPTGKILYSPSKSGQPILCGSGGKPMAQYVG